MLQHDHTPQDHATHVVKVAIASRNSVAAALKSRVAIKKNASYTCTLIDPSVTSYGNAVLSGLS
jgi:hypothetical protein